MCLMPREGLFNNIAIAFSATNDIMLKYLCTFWFHFMHKTREIYI